MPFAVGVDGGHGRAARSATGATRVPGTAAPSGCRQPALATAARRLAPAALPAATHLMAFWAPALLLGPLICAAPAAPRCPCSNSSLCRPLTLPKRPEFVAFEDRRRQELHGDGCESYPSPSCTVNLSSAITTLVDWNGKLPAQLYCDAHAKGIRIVQTTENTWPSWLMPPSGQPPPTAAAIRAWAAGQVGQLLDGGLPGKTGMVFDGLNIDWEQSVAYNDTRSRAAMAAAIRELRVAMDARTPQGSLQISFDAGWAPWGLPQANGTAGTPPACVDGRCFDFAALSKSLSGENDFIFVMDYAMQSQIYYDKPLGGSGRCVAGADCPLSKVQLGMQQFLQAG